MKAFIGLHERGWGFYVSLAGAAAVFAAACVYAAAYGPDPDFSAAVAACAFLAPLCFALLTAFRPTAPLACPVCAALAYAALLVFLTSSVIYLSDVFFGGVTAAAIAALKPAFTAFVVLMTAGVALTTLGIFARQGRKGGEGA